MTFVVHLRQGNPMEGQGVEVGVEVGVGVEECVPQVQNEPGLG